MFWCWFNLLCLSALSLEYDENKSIVFRPSGKVSKCLQSGHIVGLLYFFLK